MILCSDCGNIVGSIQEAHDGTDAFSIESEKKNSCELHSMIKTDHLSSEHETKFFEMLEKHNDKVENKTGGLKIPNQTSDSFERRKSCVFTANANTV